MEVALEVIFWFVVFVGTGALLFTSVYKLILFADLTVDHINPMDLCDYVNKMVVPEYVGHVILFSIMLLRGYVVAAILNVPLVLFHVHCYMDRRYLIDSTTIFAEVERERTISQFKLGHHLVMFFVYLYFFIATLIAD